MSSAIQLALDKGALKTTAIATALIIVKLFVTITIQGGKRFAAGSRPPEDTALKLNKKMGKGREQSFGVDAVNVDDAKAKKAKSVHLLDDLRWQRIVMNDIENIPMGLVAMYGSLLTPYSATTHSILSLAFVAARQANPLYLTASLFNNFFFAYRYTHTYVYAKGLQPARAIAWMSTWLSVFGFVINGVAGALTL
ncbi:hypothetical protein HDU67_000384 [Dinochytrium kinnereticum]|nr:hypothetical protein HDU67_000384 [Dinochytrium kinnereticum]